jgi:HEAT repeat protein
VIAELWLWTIGACAAGDGAAADGPVVARVESVLRRWNDAPATLAALADELARLGPEAAPRIAELLEQPGHGDVPAEALALSLARAADERSVACLRRLATTADDEARVAALAGLAAVPDAAHLDVLVGALDGASDAVRDAAFAAISSWIELHPALVATSRLDRPLGACRRLSSSARLLARLGTRDARAVLRGMLESPDAERVSAALDGFAETDDVEAREAMRALLGPATPREVRRKACLVLGRLEDADAIPDLIEVVGDEDGGLASDARWALEWITGEHLAADPELWNEWWTGAGPETRARLRRPRVPVCVERRARRALDGMLERGVEESLVRARIEEGFGVGEAVVSGWLAARAAAPAPAALSDEAIASVAPTPGRRAAKSMRATLEAAPETAAVASLLQLGVLLAACAAAAWLHVCKRHRRVAPGRKGRRVRRGRAARGPIVEPKERVPTLEVVSTWKD